MHEIIRIGDVSVTFLKRGEETNGQFCLCEIVVPPHELALAHPYMHLDFDEVVVGIDGFTRWTVGSDDVILGLGERLHIPRRMPHMFRNCQDYTARFASIYQPGVVDPVFFRELGQAAELIGPIRAATMGEVMTRFRTVPMSES